MTTDEKKLLQAKHRLEEAEMRDRNKERKARTRRLIQEGAILEKVFPSITSLNLDELEDYSMRIKSADIETRGVRATEASRFFYPEGRTYSPPRRGGGISYGNRALCEADAAPAGASWTMLASHHCPRSRLNVLLRMHNKGMAILPPPQPPACENLPPTVLSQLWVSLIATPIFFCEKETKTENERTVRTDGNLSLGSKGGQQRFGAICGCRFRLSELYQYLKRL